MGRRVPIVRQQNSAECGIACLAAILGFHHSKVSFRQLLRAADLDRSGVTMSQLAKLADRAGFKAEGFRMDTAALRQLDRPAILHFDQEHFVVLDGQHRKGIRIMDPVMGRRILTWEELQHSWERDDGLGVVLTISPVQGEHPRSADLFPDREEGAGEIIRFLGSYLRVHSGYVLPLLIGTLLTALITMSMPFFTQLVVDTGIQLKSIRFIQLLLFANLMIFIGGLVVNVSKSWLLLHVGAMTSIHILGDFLSKLFKLPVRFFDSRTLGDLLQRVEDHEVVERLITTTSLNVIFSFFNLVALSIVLAIYDWTVFIVFTVGSLLSVTWVLIFLQRRKYMNYASFLQQSKNQGFLIQSIEGYREIKLANAEYQKQQEWEMLQQNLLRVRLQSLTLEQTQHIGNSFVTQVKNLLITFWAAQGVIQGNISLGMMMAIMFITGQLNGPIQQLILFAHTFQDAKLSLDRIVEVHGEKEEAIVTGTVPLALNQSYEGDIKLNHIWFRYSDTRDHWVLRDLNCVIPKGKVTALVGVSGGGKTTLLKLLLRFYSPVKGQMQIGKHPFNSFALDKWRNQCGVVLQDGYLFSETVLDNITIGRTGKDMTDINRAWQSLELVSAADFVKELPHGIHTRIGQDGLSLSEGQKQRLLLARAVYKDPPYMFLDEATSFLDANNEKAILKRLNEFFLNRTVLVIAHRLSTVRDADQILVLHEGRLVESGSHFQLVQTRGKYFELVKNQLELGVHS